MVFTIFITTSFILTIILFVIKTLIMILIITGKILFDRRYGKALSIYSRFVGMTISELFSSDISLWNQ